MRNAAAALSGSLPASPTLLTLPLLLPRSHCNGSAGAGKGASPSNWCHPDQYASAKMDE